MAAWLRTEVAQGSSAAAPHSSLSVPAMSSYQDSSSDERWPLAQAHPTDNAPADGAAAPVAAPAAGSGWSARRVRMAQIAVAACALLLILAIALKPAADNDSRSSKHDSKRSSKQSHSTSASTQTAKMPSDAAPSSSAKPPRATNSSIINSADACNGPFPGYPYCQDHVDWMTKNWAITPEQEAYYRSKGVDGTQCSFLTYLNLNGFYCPEAADATKRTKIRGVNLGGWLVLEPWIVPSLFEQFAVTDGVQDQWTFCAHLGPKECRRQLVKHWDTWLQQSDLQFLAESGINHVRIPVGYWLFGDIRRDEPWVAGELPYLERAIKWCRDLGLHVVLDLHCAPGSQNGFDNSGRKGEVHFDDELKSQQGRVRTQTVYPNIRRALEVIANLTSHFSSEDFSGTVVGIELVNEAFVTIPIEVVKDYYLQGYEIVKQNGDTMAVIIGDSFRFGAWNDFMFPPHYRHVWIDTHIYQVFDLSRLSMTWQQHLTQTCKLNKPEVAVAPLSTMVGEWSLATTDCARWLNGYNTGSRFDGSFFHPPGSVIPKDAPAPLGQCAGQADIHNRTIWTPEYISFLKQYSAKQMDAYESGSSEGWFFWNFKVEKGAPQWDYMLGVREGWIPKDLDNRDIKC